MYPFIGLRLREREKLKEPTRLVDQTAKADEARTFLKKKDLKEVIALL
jgi:hypothetical protein